MSSMDAPEQAEDVTSSAEGAAVEDAAGASAKDSAKVGGSSKNKAAAPPPRDLAQRVEAALLATDRALSAAKLGEAAGCDDVKAVGGVIDELNTVYEKTGRAFRVEQVAGGWQLMTLPEYSGVLDRMHKSRSQHKLTPATMETLAIIAYRQPILRVDVEAVRGVACGEMIRSLMDMHLVKIVGRADQIGRPMLYGTTKHFLEVFGLASLKDLPKIEELAPPKA